MDRINILIKHINSNSNIILQSQNTHSTLDLSLFIISKEVKHALDNNLPVVALESTIISHGMPYPQNYNTALEVEKVVSDNGAVPATIAIIEGKIHIGLNKEQINDLAKMGPKVLKCSRRDLSYALSTGAYGATTVSATMILAHRVGIPIFATGGIGGVHRGAESTFDISADLTELGRTNVAVVCAGVKSILDIPKTLEYLETQGVTVCTYKSSQFPAFFTKTSGSISPLIINDNKSCAKMIHNGHKMGIENGIVIAVPINDKDEANATIISNAQNQAIAEAKQQGISGRDVTPFLLKRVKDLTNGASLTSNISLIKQNAGVASQIAVELSFLKRNSLNNSQFDVCVLGGNSLDIIGKPFQNTVESNKSPGSTLSIRGGVGRNIAEAVARCGVSTSFISIIGNDERGSGLIADCNKIGINTSFMLKDNAFSSPSYLAILDKKGEVAAAISDFEIMDSFDCKKLSKDFFNIIEKRRCKLIILDGNIPISSIFTLSKVSFSNQIPVIFETTSINKCIKITSSLKNSLIWCIAPNVQEFFELYNSLYLSSKKIPLMQYNENFSLEVNLALIKKMCIVYFKNSLLSHIVIKMGKFGLFVASRSDVPSNLKSNLTLFPNFVLKDGQELLIVFTYINAFEANVKIVSTSGAGDTFVGVFAAILVYGYSVLESCFHANKAANLTLKTMMSVSTDISFQKIFSK